MKLSSLACVLLLAAHGCGSSSPPPPAETPEVAPATDPTDQVGANDDEATSDLAEHHRHHHHGGIPMFVAMSLDTIGVDDNQRDQIEKIQADIHAELKPAKDAEKAALLALADGVAAGNDRSGTHRCRDHRARQGQREHPRCRRGLAQRASSGH